MPGKRANSVIRSSIADTGYNGRLSGNGCTLRISACSMLLRPPLGLVHRRQDQIAQELGVVLGEDGRVDHDRPHRPAAVRGDPHQPSARGRFNDLAGKLGLNLLQPTLHLLAKLE